jgi:hypothetical protein
MKVTKQPHLKKVRERIISGLDVETGEVVNAKKEDFVLSPGPINYYMVFTQIEHIIKKATDMPVVKLIYWLGKNLQDNKNFICLNLTIKKEIMAAFNISLAGVERGITELKKDFLLLPYSKDRTAMYRINPTFIWKGSLDDRHHAMKSFLEEVRVAKLPDVERKILKMQEMYERAIAIEEAVYKYDFRKIPAAQYEPYKAA